MLCSECSRPIKPVIAWDIDGTLGDYHTHFSNFALAYWDMERPIGDYPWDGSGEFEDWIGITKDQYREAKLAYRQGGQKRTMPAFENAISLVRYYYDLGLETWVTTTRPWNRLDNIDPDTREWMRRNKVPHDGLIFGDNKYDLLCESVDKDRVVCVIDDLPELIEQASRLGLDAWQMWTQWNRNLNRRQQGASADFIDIYIGGSLKTWKEWNGIATIPRRVEVASSQLRQSTAN